MRKHRSMWQLGPNTLAAGGFVLFGVAALYGIRRLNRWRQWKNLDRKVDEASDDSFPASDPPASMMTA